MNRQVASALAVAISAVSACAEPQVDVQAETAALRAAALSYDNAAQALDAQAVASLYMENAVAYPPNEPTVRGRSAFEEYAAGFVSTPGIRMSFGELQVVVAVSGDLGYTYEDVAITFDGPDGEPVTETLRDFHVWTKDAEGAWRVAVDIWNSPTPLPSM